MLFGINYYRYYFFRLISFRVHVKYIGILIISKIMLKINQ